MNPAKWRPVFNRNIEGSDDATETLRYPAPTVAQARHYRPNKLTGESGMKACSKATVAAALQRTSRSARHCNDRCIRCVARERYLGRIA